MKDMLIRKIKETLAAYAESVERHGIVMETESTEKQEYKCALTKRKVRGTGKRIIQTASERVAVQRE